jgi:hypothetical protein
MQHPNDHTLNLSLNAEARFVPLVTQFAETASTVFGMGTDESLRLRLAAEEIYLYLCEAVCPGILLEIQCTNGLYYTRVLFCFTVSKLNLSGLNIASGIARDQDADLAEMGLLIAARSVDRLSIASDQRGRISLAVTKNKAYPRVEETLPPPEHPAALKIETPDIEGVKRFALRVAQCCAGPLLPGFFGYPGKVADMVASGEYETLAALNQKRDIVGGVLFHHRSEKIVQSFGPYTFAEKAEDRVAGELLNACISEIARTKAIGLFSVSGLPESLRSRFETLGSLTCYRKDGPPLKRDYFYRHLHEDPVCEVWMHGALEAFLRREYDRLVLAREMREVHAMGESLPGSSIFSAELLGEKSQAVLRPLWPGSDLDANVRRHIRYLRKDGFLNILFELDLGVSWHAVLIPVLAANGFRPEILLPFAGQSDLVVFQHHATES